MADSPLTFAQMQGVARLIMQDNDSAATPNYGIDDTLLKTLVNEALRDFMASTDRSITAIATVTTVSGDDGVYAPVLSVAGDRIRRWLRCVPTSGGTPLERLEVNEWKSLVSSGSYVGIANSGVPRFWALEMVGQTTLQAWRVYIWPNTTATPLTFYGEIVPSEMYNSTSTPNLTKFESYIVARMAAVRGATLLGRSQQFIQSISEGLENKTALAEAFSGQYLNPRRRTDEESG